jgi:hypothetical protein
MKTVLMIAPNFPPTSAVGGIRSVKFAKYLPLFGWKPVVVTVSEKAKKVSDPSFLADLPPEVEIHAPHFFNYRKYVPGDILKLVKPLERKFIFPDMYVRWNRPALRYICRRILGSHKIDLVYVSLGPHSALLLASELKRRLGLPLVLDFRDPFSFSQYSILDHKDEFQKRARAIEAAVLPLCDHINVVTRVWQQRYASLYPTIADRMGSIHNGYDEADFLGLSSKAPNPVFTVGYNGTFSRLAPLAPLLDAIAKIHRNTGRTIRLKIATPTHEKKLRSRYDYHYKNNLIEFNGFMNHKESLKNLHKADIVALILDNIPATEGQMPAKTFEYLRIDRPILLIHREHGQLAELIQRTRTGRCVAVQNPDQIASTLLDFQQSWERQALLHDPDWNEIEKYERKNLTGELAAVFNRLTQPKP